MVSSRGINMDFIPFLKATGAKVAIIHGITGTLIPIILVIMMTRFFGPKRSWKEGLSIFPFALFAGLCFTVPYTLTGILLGPEFPSLFGSLLGLLIVIPLAKSGFLIPKNIWDFPPRETWPAEWIGQKINKVDEAETKMSIFRAWFPYILVALLLLFSRLLNPLKALLASVSLEWTNIFQTSLSTSFPFLYLPGFLFFVAGLATIIFQKISFNQTKKVIRRSFQTILGPTIALQFTTALKIGAVPGVIVALQAVGGAAGNMICVHNVVAASAVVGLLGKEGLLIRKTLIPMTYYLIVAAIIGIIMLQFFKV